MPEPDRRAFLDANILRGHLQTDVLLTLADKGAFQPRWSAQVLDEVRRNRPPRLSEQAIDHRLNQMNLAFPRAMVSGHEHLEPEMQADAKDKHVLAAAVHSHSTVLVTENVKDFYPPTTGPYAVKVERTSQFLNQLVDDNPQRAIAAMNEMISRTRREPNTMSALIDKMASQHDLIGFAHKLNSVVESEHRGTHSSLPQRTTSARAAALDGLAPASGSAYSPTRAPEARRPMQQDQDKGRGTGQDV